jgi:hypothetical protein
MRGRCGRDERDEREAIVGGEEFEMAGKARK